MGSTRTTRAPLPVITVPADESEVPFGLDSFAGDDGDDDDDDQNQDE